MSIDQLSNRESSSANKPSFLSWWGIVRLGLVQTSLGAIVVLTTATMNRVMVVEYALPATLPGALVAFHYMVQMLRPKFGYGSDVGGNRTRWIIGGMIVLALGGTGAAVGTALMGSTPVVGIAIAFIAFLLIGAGVGASGTSLLALLAKQVEKTRRPAAATIVWFMMIMGFALTAGLAGHFLDPFSGQRLIMVTAVVSIIAVAVTVLSLYKIELQNTPRIADVELASSADLINSADSTGPEKKFQTADFKHALKEVWAESEARSFTIFVFISMLAYSAQDLILEPFAGTVFGLTPGESTQLSGMQHGGVLIGMILVAISGTFLKKFKSHILRFYVVSGCLASAVALCCLAVSGFNPHLWSIKANVFALGIANGAFAVAAIGSMMTLAGRGRKNREGLRMGLWGASQAIAFGLGGFLGTVAIDIATAFYSDPALAYALVFTLEGSLFIVAAKLGLRIRQNQSESDSPSSVAFFGDPNLAEISDVQRAS